MIWRDLTGEELKREIKPMDPPQTAENIKELKKTSSREL